MEQKFERELLDVLQVAKHLYDVIRFDNFGEINNLRETLELKKKQVKKDMTAIEDLTDDLILKYQQEFISREEIEKGESDLKIKKNNFLLKLENVIEVHECILLKYDKILADIKKALGFSKSLSTEIKKFGNNETMAWLCRREISFWFESQLLHKINVDADDFEKIFEEIEFEDNELLHVCQILHLKMFSSDEVKKVWKAAQRYGHCLKIEDCLPTYLEVRCLRE